MNGPLGASQCNLKAPTIFVDEGEIADKSLLPIKGKFTIKDLRTANQIPISIAPSMSFYPDFILILSRFCLDFILNLS